jgi:hypothetical protein
MLHTIGHDASQVLVSYEMLGNAAAWTAGWTRTLRPFVTVQAYPASWPGAQALCTDHRFGPELNRARADDLHRHHIAQTHVLEQLAGKRLDRWVLDSWVLDRCLDAAADALVVLTRVVILFSTSLVAVTLALLIHVAASRRHLSFVTQDSFVAIAGLTQDSSQDVRVTLAAARQRRLEH